MGGEADRQSSEGGEELDREGPIPQSRQGESVMNYRAGETSHFLTGG